MHRLRGKRVVILTAYEFEDIEVLVPVVRLSEEGAKVTVATLRKEAFAHFHPRPYFPGKPITGRFGSTIPFVVLEEGKLWHHKEIHELKVDDYDLVLIPGGFAPDYLRIDDTTLQFVADMYRAGKWVAAICHGPQVLISTDARKGTDIVRGRRVTCYRAVVDDIISAGGRFTDTGVVTDGNVITGRCPDDLPEFCLAMIEALQQPMDAQQKRGA